MVKVNYKCKTRNDLQIEKVFFVMFALLTFCMFSFADLSVANTTTIPAIVRPGSQGIVSMAITNSDSTDIMSVNAEAVGTGGIVSSSSKFLGDYKSGTSGTVALPFTVPQSANAGVYSLAIKLSWINSTGTFYKNVYVPITISNPAIFSAVSLNKAIMTTGDFDVKIKLSNSGGNAKNARVSINSTQFLQTGTNPYIVGDIANGNFSEFELGITLAPNVVSGAYSIPVSITYYDEAGTELSSEAKLRLEVKRTSPNIDIALAHAQQFIPGSEVQLVMNVENNGDEKAYDVRVGVASASDLAALGTSTQSAQVLTSLGTTFVSVGDIEPSQSKQVTINAGVNDLDSGFYRQLFVVKAKNAKGDQIADELAPIGINLEGLTDVEVFISSKPAPINANMEHTLSVLVSNIGTSPIKALIVGIDGGDLFELQEAQNEQFIGGLVEDDFSTVQYKVRMNNVLAKDYPVNITTKFKDNYNRDIVKIHTLKLRVVGQDASGESGFLSMLLPMIVVAVLLFLFYWFFYRQKHQTGKK